MGLNAPLLSGKDQIKRVLIIADKFIIEHFANMEEFK